MKTINRRTICINATKSNQMTLLKQEHYTAHNSDHYDYVNVQVLGIVIRLLRYEVVNNAWLAIDTNGDVNIHDIEPYWFDYGFNLDYVSRNVGTVNLNGQILENVKVRLDESMIVDKHRLNAHVKEMVWQTIVTIDFTDPYGDVFYEATHKAFEFEVREVKGYGEHDFYLCYDDHGADYGTYEELEEAKREAEKLRGQWLKELGVEVISE